MGDYNYSESDIKFWVGSTLSKENFSSIKVLSFSTKYKGYLSNIVFVNILATTQNDEPKEMELVLKCNHTDSALRENMPVRQCFDNELHVYTHIIPEFTQFQKIRGLEDIFSDFFAKFYGSYEEKNFEVLTVQNLSELGFSVYDHKQPMTRKHLNLVIETLAKWHAISAAMQNQFPHQFQGLADAYKDIVAGLGIDVDVEKFVGYPLHYVYDLLEHDISEKSKEKLKRLNNQINYVMKELLVDQKYFGVATHGDCWNNNYMFAYKDDQPEKVAMIDFQWSRISSPVTDLSYFMYACISKDDLDDFDNILKFYHKHFTDYMKKLGSNADKIYPFSQLQTDWPVFSKYGLLMTFLNAQLDMGDLDEDTLDDRNPLKERLLYVVEHVTERDFI